LGQLDHPVPGFAPGAHTLQQRQFAIHDGQDGLDVPRQPGG
jgi:hypothetical protein